MITKYFIIKLINKFNNYWSNCKVKRGKERIKMVYIYVNLGDTSLYHQVRRTERRRQLLFKCIVNGVRQKTWVVSGSK